MGAQLASVPEVTDYQAYAGLAAPINFNGLVRQYYLRQRLGSGRPAGQPAADKTRASRKSHDIAQRCARAGGDRAALGAPR